MQIDNKKVGHRIKSIRLAIGESMEEFGKRFNTSKGTVNNWEKGRNLPNKKNLLVIATLGNIEVEDLLGTAKYSYNKVVYTLRSMPDELLNDITNSLGIWLDNLYNSGGEMFLSDTDSYIYFKKLYGRMYQLINTSKSISENIDFIVEVLSDNIFDDINSVVNSNSRYSLSNEIDLLNLEYKRTDDILKFLIKYLEDLAKFNKNILGFMIQNRIGNTVSDLNFLLKNDHFNGMAIQQYGAFKNPDAVIPSIDYDVYKEIQKQLVDVIEYTRIHLTDKD
ncbi:hypothetical protein SPSF3K_00094 [Streptococcus parauberis]|uniref:Transcriptional regulator, XRE family n=1 Tax=Streptococcus parauberis KRS-02083 TaxID=1207545 RepID=A0ABN0IP61_9STRE|nr:hypothetical protein SPSF3K_00094 [Streptococcus parauberis]EMG24583.1 Transcriptional regulator, XRE family [Streptococcus parauberis KRS-02083]QBX09833.1 XRE family transcriptional regulator [Streptococcus satellite phage Javan390]QBX09877.1 XRE family transcriptional regulator [Streptococcus satellite phage Javan395]WOF46918.1 helix-turn-helix domain-containing protein [Streptococcus parauberis]